MTQPPDERAIELRDLFFETSQELLQALNDQALQLENHPGDEEVVRSLRRTVHTLKGDSAACGLREMSELAHQFEDALSLESAASHADRCATDFAPQLEHGPALRMVSLPCRHSRHRPPARRETSSPPPPIPPRAVPQAAPAARWRG